MTYEQINSQQIANSTNKNVRQVLDFLEQGETILRNQYREQNVTFILGNTGAGKSTFIQWITGDNTQLISKRDPKTLNGFVIYDTSGKIGNSTTISKTIFPELIVDTKTGAAYYDFPGFYDTRGAAHDIATTFFIKKVVDHTKNVKIVFIVNHNSVTNQGTRDDFTNLIKFTTKFVKNIDKFQNSIVLIASKVSNAYSSNSDNEIISFIPRFIEEVKQNLVQNAILSDLSDKEKMNAIKFLETLLIKDGEVYPKIGLFRSPNKEGPLSNITLLQENKKHIETILEKLHFTTKTNDDFGYMIPKASLYDIGGIVNELNKNILTNVGAIGEEIKKYFSSKEGTIHDIHKLSHEMRLGHDKMFAIKNATQILEPEQCIQHIKNDVTSIVNSSSINQNLSNSINYSNYFKFLQIVSSQSITNSFKCAEGLSNVIEYLNNSHKWYHFLMHLYNRLSEYSIQENTSTCKNLTNNITQKDENKVANTGLEQFLKVCYPQYESYNDIKNIILDKSKLNALNKVFNLTLKHRLDQVCDSRSPDKLIIKGQYVKLSDIDTHTCPVPIKFIEIFALKKVFIDTNLNKTGEKIHLSIIAPIWDIQGAPKIILDGEPGKAHNPTKARDGLDSGSNGEDGKPGMPGGSAGHFLGIGAKFINGQYLTISANGGTGGPGQHGGDGTQGQEGKMPWLITTNIEDEGAQHGFKVKFLNHYTVGPDPGMMAAGAAFFIIGIIPATIVTWANMYTWIIGGHDGQRGGNAGNGGIGGKGGNSGTIIITSRDSDIIINSIQGNNGTGGIGGCPGIGGKKGQYLIEYILSTPAYQYNSYWFFDAAACPASCTSETNCTSKDFDLKVRQGHVHNITQGTYEPYKDILPVLYYSFCAEPLYAASGIAGHDGDNSKDLQNPELVPFFNPSYTVNSYKNYLRENLSGNIRESDLRDFLNLLDTNGNVDTISRSRRHHHGENHQRVHRDIDDSNNIQYDTDGIIVAADTKFAMSAASNIKSPINIAINWLSNSLGQLKFLNPANMLNYKLIQDGIHSMFGESKQLNSCTTNYSNNAVNVTKINVNESLTLADLIIRCVTKVKPYNTKEESTNLLEVKAYVLGTITEFEEMLNEASAQNNLPIEDLEFNPVDLMCKLEKEVINGNYTKIGKILYQSIIDNNSNLDETQFSSYIQDKISEILAQQNAGYLHNQQFITDHTSNSHTIIEDLKNTIGIANDFNHTNYQSEINLIG